MTAVRERVIRVKGIRLHVREVGEGPPVLLINGLGGHSGMWATLEDALPGLRLIEFDAPGMGQSATLPFPLTIHALASIARRVLDAVDVERADALGYSLGGLIAQQLAVAAPERVRRLVLAGTSCGLGSVAGGWGAMLNVALPLRYYSRGFYERTIGHMTGGRARHDPAWVARQGDLRLAHPPTTVGYMAQVLSASTFSSLPVLHRIRQPTLVVAGGDDPLVPIANGVILARRLPNGRLLVAPDEGHLLLLDEDSSALRSIREFLCAEDLDTAPVWLEADVVGDDDVRAAVAASRQAQPFGVLNAALRCAWAHAERHPRMMSDPLSAAASRRWPPVLARRAGARADGVGAQQQA
jgi:poly(3-hydroxyoctanoate) depolymerase